MGQARQTSCELAGLSSPARSWPTGAAAEIAAQRLLQHKHTQTCVAASAPVDSSPSVPDTVEDASSQSGGSSTAPSPASSCIACCACCRQRYHVSATSSARRNDRGRHAARSSTGRHGSAPVGYRDEPNKARPREKDPTQYAPQQAAPHLTPGAAPHTSYPPGGSGPGPLQPMAATRQRQQLRRTQQQDWERAATGDGWRWQQGKARRLGPHELWRSTAQRSLCGGRPPHAPGQSATT